ncbi:unnamed protein product [Coffea canephora]|uniref:Major facilitator superfamily (MFS) profile domain-containing protein n=1 Tax=Coffea canephora TaxID=49390 RepID=A0A068UAT3_COFCA|nr:unnamed protein product [Coffea canephora]
MEGGINPEDAIGFKDCLLLARKNPYVLRLAFSTGIGGLLFYYDTGVISGALLYIRDDFKAVDKQTVLQESIVSMAVAGAIIGAAIGGWLNDRFGRRSTWDLALDAWSCWNTSVISIRSDATASRIPPIAMSQGQSRRSRKDQCFSTITNQNSKKRTCSWCRSSSVPAVCGHKYCDVLQPYNSPPVSAAETYFGGYTCPDYHSAGSASWDCTKCLNASSPSCGFCASTTAKIIECICVGLFDKTVQDACRGEDRLWYRRGCSSRYGWLALIGLALNIIFFSPGMGTVPWIVNSAIYPLRFRGICGGIAATANWISNLIVAQSFISLTQAIRTSWTFLIFGVVSVAALLFVLVSVPETKGLPIEEIEKILERKALQLKFWEKRPDNKNQDVWQK